MKQYETDGTVISCVAKSFFLDIGYLLFLHPSFVCQFQVLLLLVYSHFAHF